MNVFIKHIEESEPDALAAAIARVKRYYGDAAPSVLTEPAICCNTRTKDGWLEYVLAMTPADAIGPTPYVHMIQRTTTSEIEFHS